MTSALFTPTTLGAIALKNRIVMAPLTRSRANPMGVPASFAATYYAQRASAGLIIAEATMVSAEGTGYPRTPGAFTPEQMASWRRIVEGVHQAGGRIVLQIMHVGRIANALNRGIAAATVAPSAIAAPAEMWTDQQQMQPHDSPRALETHEIARVVADFVTAAENAMAAGFDGVEIHSANGYLLQQFLSTNVNQRTDRYGGSIANRVRMPLEVVEAVTAKVPREKVGIRISPAHTFNAIEERDAPELYAHYIGELNRYGLAYLHVMRPFANQAAMDAVTMARGIYKGSVIAAGGYTGTTGAALIAAGGADAIAYGKDFIANPDLVERLRDGKPLSPPDQSTFYTPGEKGYTDYPRAA